MVVDSLNSLGLRIKERNMKIERFNINYIDLAKGNIVTIEINKPKKFSIKAFWDEDFNRGYKIYKNKGVSNVEVFSWIPSLMGPIELPEKIPQYISEFLYDLYNFEFPHGSERKDIKLKSFFNYKDSSDTILALLLKTRAESKVKKKLDLLGPAGIHCNYCFVDDKNNSVTKLFRINSNTITYNTGIKEDSFSDAKTDNNDDSFIYRNIEPYDFILNTLLN